MDPGVPFAFLAATQLLAVGAFLGLAGTAARRSPEARRTRAWMASGPATVGALAVLVADAYTGARLGPAGSNTLVAVQAAGLVLLAVGLAVRAPGPAPPAALSIAPLGAALPPSIAGVAGGVLAAAAALRQRDVPARLLAAGLLVTGAALAFAPAARTHAPAALALLSTRAAGALLVLAALVVLTRTSVLAKVVTAIGLGVLATAIGTAAVVGTVVSDQLVSDQSRQLVSAAQGAGTDLANDTDTAVQLARLVAACPPAQLVTCARGIAVIAPTDAFAVVVDPAGTPTFAGGTDALDPSLLRALVATDAVQQARNPVPGHPFEGSGFVLLRGDTEQLVALGVESVTTGGQTSVIAYGEQVGDRLMRQTRQRSTFDATVLALPSGTPLASSLSPADAAALAASARPVLGHVTSAETAISRIGQGRAPAAAYILLPSGTQRIAALALSGSSASVLRSQRAVLGLLFLALLVIGALVGLVALLLGRRAVEPVRRLTAAARSVGAGDLSVRPRASTADEVGELASVFAAMTGSLETLTGDLRRTAETEAATRERLGTVIDAMADALVVSDADGRIDLANPAAVRLLGEVVGSRADEVIVDPLGAPLAAGEGWLHAGGREVPVAVARAALPAGRGTVHVLRDVTAARELERAKTEFLSNVSHELRTPLTPIQGYADLLRRRSDLSPDEVRTMAESIGTGARRMARVVGLLVDVAALDAGRIRPTAVPLAPTAFLDERLAAWRARTPGVDIRRRVSAGTPDVLADAEWLARAVDELIDNAIAHGAGPITLLAQPGEPGRVTLAVRDSGAGLHDDAHASLFADFEQVDGSATRTRDGLGLGLAFVRRVSGLLDATVSATSRPGSGATFALDLPASGRRPRRRQARGGSTV
ncbi:MAG TPA: ATP-binding protein [Mycobacteriales bacterium]